MWWENEPLQSISKSLEQTQKKKKNGIAQKDSPYFSFTNGMAWTIDFRGRISSFPF